MSTRQRRAQLRATGPLTSTVALATVAVSLLSGCRNGAGELPRSSESLRYELVSVAPSAGYRGNFEAADLDGDGVDEEIKYDVGIGGAAFLSVARIHGNQFYHLATRHLLAKGGISGVTDTTGDGTQELVWWWHDTPERVHVFVSSVNVENDSATLEQLHSIGFDTAGNLLPDGQWGASIAMCGAFDLDGDGVTDAVALTANAGITLVPREILLWNLKTNDIAWRLPTGATPTGGASVVDVTDDGRPDLIIGLEAPGNGATAGIWNDGHSYIIAVDADGSLLWSQELAGFSSNVELAAADLDGDGRTEVVTAVNYHSESDLVPPELAVWSGTDGALLDTLRIGYPANAVLIERCEEGDRIFVGSSDGTLRRIGWEPGALTVEGTIDCRDAVEVLASVEMTPLLDGWSLAVGTGTGAVALVDEWLNPVAMLELDETLDGSRRLRPTTARGPEGNVVGGLIVRTDDKTHRYMLMRRPLPLWLRLLVPAIAALVLALVVPTSRRGLLASLRRWLLPRDTRDDSVEKLLTALATAGHGKLAATSTLRRLKRQTEMIVSGDGDVPPAFADRFLDAIANAGDVGIPGLEAIVKLSEHAGTAPAHTGRLSSALAGLHTLLRGLPTELPDESASAALGSALNGVISTIDGALRGIKLAAESERSSSLGTELGRALGSRSAEMSQLGVELEAPNPDALRSARVVGTASEISFVLDNLLGNAFAAMDGSSVRRLSISIEVGPKWVALTVEDSGKGVEESMREQIFTRGVSDKAGGGHGLSLSREILGRRGGTIEMARSTPGEGSVFEIKLRLLGTA